MRDGNLGGISTVRNMEDLKSPTKKPPHSVLYLARPTEIDSVSSEI